MKLSQSLMVLLMLAISATAVSAQTPALTVTPVSTAHNIEIKQSVKQDLVFKEVEAKETIKTLVKSLKLNPVFDESVRLGNKLDLELNNVTPETALKVIFIQQKLRAFLIDDNTVYIHADSPQIKERFGVYPSWMPKSN